MGILCHILSMYRMLSVSPQHYRSAFMPPPGAGEEMGPVVQLLPSRTLVCVSTYNLHLSYSRYINRAWTRVTRDSRVNIGHGHVLLPLLRPRPSDVQ